MASAQLDIQFLGGAGTVTGSKYLVTCKSASRTLRILVDCGMFQGLKELRLLNREPFPIAPSDIDAAILTHAHLDHTGHLPLLVKQGFRGPIYCSQPTRELSRLILEDSAHLQEEDAAFANRHGFSKHAPALPLYTVTDAHAAMKLFRPVSAAEWHELAPDTRFKLVSSGHILGSTFVVLEIGGKRIVFSGDLGRAQPWILNAPEVVTQADYLLIESTYGDRCHPPAHPLDELEKAILETLERKGHILIPSFAVGRTQEILHLLAELKRGKRIPDIPVFLDSPLGIHATEVFVDHPEWHRLTRAEVDALAGGTILVKSQQQSKDLMAQRKSSIIIAGSGMISGGRILHHLTMRLGDERNSILLAGYQAAGTRGRQLQDGAAELKIFGQYYPVKARVVTISGLSAHADQREILSWLSGFSASPRKTFIVHGEPGASDALRVRIRDRFGWECTIPRHRETTQL